MVSVLIVVVSCRLSRCNRIVPSRLNSSPFVAHDAAVQCRQERISVSCPEPYETTRHHTPYLCPVLSHMKLLVTTHLTCVLSWALPNYSSPHTLLVSCPESYETTRHHTPYLCPVLSLTKLLVSTHLTCVLSWALPNYSSAHTLLVSCPEPYQATRQHTPYLCPVLSLTKLFVTTHLTCVLS